MANFTEGNNMIFLTNNLIKQATMSSTNPEDENYFPWENMFDNFLYTVGTFEDDVSLSFSEKKDVNIVALVSDSNTPFTLQASNFSDFSNLLLDTSVVGITDLPDTGLYLHVFKANNPLYDSSTDYLQDNEYDAILDNNDNKIKAVLTGFAGKYSAMYWRVLKAGVSNVYHMFMGVRFTFPDPLFGSYPMESNTDVFNNTVSGQGTVHKGYEYKEQNFQFSNVPVNIFTHLKKEFASHRAFPGILIQTENNIDHRPVFFAHWMGIRFGGFNGLRKNTCMFSVNFKEQK